MSKKTNELEIEDISTPSQIVKINKSGVVDLSTLSQEKIDELTERANNVTPENILNLGADARSQISSAADVFLDKVRTSEVVEFGIDNMESGFSVRQHLGDKHNLEKVATEIDVPYTTIYKFTPKSFEDIIKQANELFASEKKEGRIIEGVVIRTLHSNAISCKYLNDEYDASK